MRIRSLVLGAVLSGCVVSLAGACGGRAGAGGSASDAGSSGSASEAGSSGGSAGEAGGSGGAAGSASDECSSLETAFCNKLAQCSPTNLQEGFGDVNNCITRMTKTCKVGADAPGVSETAAQMTACVAAISQHDCTEFLHGSLCPGVFEPTGSLADGEPCTWGYQCQSGYCNVTWVPPSGPCGDCEQAVAVGKACGGGQCQTGLVCNSNHVCAQPVQAGGVCSGPEDCASGLVCASGICSGPLALGQACSTGECDWQAGAGCNPSTHVCDLLQLADPGQPCGLVNSVLVDCRNNGRCAGQQPGGQGICQAAVPDGTACDLQAGPPCLMGSLCVDGQCTFWDPALCQQPTP